MIPTRSQPWFFSLCLYFCLSHSLLTSPSGWSLFLRAICRSDHWLNWSIYLLFNPRFIQASLYTEIDTFRFTPLVLNVEQNIRFPLWLYHPLGTVIKATDILSRNYIPIRLSSQSVIQGDTLILMKSLMKRVFPRQNHTMPVIPIVSIISELRQDSQDKRLLRD